jgi:hypothetical protein
MKATRYLFLVLAVVAVSAQRPTPALAGLFKMDFGTLQNDAEGIELDDWDTFSTFTFFDFDDEIARWTLTDYSGGGDDDVTLTIIDNELLTDELGLLPPNGMIHNNPVPQLIDVEYDGIEVPAVVKDDYLYRDPDTAGTELLFQFANLNPGTYNVTLFLGRTSDANGQFGKLWVESDPDGKGEPDEENTGNFAGYDPDTGEENPEGNPVTYSFDVAAGEYLWYGHMEDNSGGISGIIIRQTAGGGPPGDFDRSGVLDAGDINDLTKQSAGGTNPATYDLNGDAAVNDTDVKVWVKDLFKSYIGDANLDHEFSSSDLVTVLAAGAYEVNTEAVWTTGDFNGDGRANTSDLVAALADGGYEAGPPPAATAAVPEPTALSLMLVAALSAVALRRRG